MLSENNLYTVEAFQEYLDHLNPGGILAVTGAISSSVTRRCAATGALVLETLRRNGVEHPEQQVVVVLGRDLFDALFGTVLVKNEPFTPEELASIKKLAAERGDGVAFVPGGPYQLEWADLAAASSPSVFCHSYKLDVCAPTDDRPFFFNMKRLGDVGQQMQGYSYAVDPVLILFLTFGVILVLAVLGYVVPLLLAKHITRPPPGALAYFVLIGLGYLLVEAVFIQRFVLMLGYPTYSLSIVLAALLAFTGVGSWLSTKWPNERRGLLLSLTAATVLIAASAFFCTVARRAHGLGAVLGVCRDDDRCARAVRSHHGDGDADRPTPLRGAASGRGAVCMGCERVRVGRRGRAGDRARPRVRLHRDDGRRVALLPGCARPRSIREVGACCSVVAWSPEGWQSGRMQWS